MPSIEQIRAARALLGWSQHDLADKADLSQTGIARIENGTNQPNSKTIAKIEAAFDQADVEFIDKTGVKKRAREIRKLNGKDGFKTFIYDVYETIRQHGGEICVSNVNERQFDKWQDVYREDYLQKMEALYKKTNFNFRILIKEGDEHKVANYAKYKSLDKDSFSNVPFYVYGDKMAIILFEEDDVLINIIESKEIAEAQRKQFELTWKTTD